MNTNPDKKDSRKPARKDDAHQPDKEHTNPTDPQQAQDKVEEGSMESFPASDPPSHTPGHA